MHDSVLNFVKSVVDEYDLANKRVLEIGSQNINGSVRSFFTGDYVGIDHEDGPGVDQVLSAHEMADHFESGEFEVVVSTECMEHDPKPWMTMHNVKHVLSPGGLLLVTCRSNGFKYHNDPDYWRFFPEAMNPLFELAECKPLIVTTDPQVPGIFAVGLRHSDVPTTSGRTKKD